LITLVPFDQSGTRRCAIIAVFRSFYLDHWRDYFLIFTKKNNYINKPVGDSASLELSDMLQLVRRTSSLGLPHPDDHDRGRGHPDCQDHAELSGQRYAVVHAHHGAGDGRIEGIGLAHLAGQRTEATPRRELQSELRADFREYFGRKERDLAFVLLFVVEETVAANAAASHALKFRLLNLRVLAGRLFVVPEKVVPWRYVQLLDFHFMHPEPIVIRPLPVGIPGYLKMPAGSGPKLDIVPLDYWLYRFL
jgi:hypothetical protein